MNKFWVAMGLLLSTTLFAEIKEIQQITELSEICGQLSRSDWILFDIDYTLIEPSHPALQMGTIKQNKQRFRDELAKFSEAQRPLVPVLMVTQVPNQLTDSSIPSLIQKLQEQHIPLLGFTSIDTSVIPGIGSIPAWRSSELKRLGIDFHSNEEIEFDEFPPFRGTFPLFKEGILYANNTVSKGEVLSAFLNKTPQKPSKIILVDDTLENLQSVEAEAAKRGVPFLGLHYKVTVDETPISELEWQEVWAKIHKRASQSPEGIMQSDHVAAIQWASQSMPEGSLIIFDVGNVLLVPKDAVLRPEHNEWLIHWLKREMPSMKKDFERKIRIILDREAEKVLVNEHVPAIINEAKQRGAVIALSKGFITERELKKFDIEFEEPFPTASGWRDEALTATYSSGMIKTEATRKGPVLKAFLDYLGWKPNAILFVDDRKEQCESLADAAKELEIPTLCVHYTEAYRHSLPLDAEVADLQLRTLVHEHYWISDEKARKVLDFMEK